jgi:spermidine/putrescine transport system permease protein
VRRITQTQDLARAGALLLPAYLWLTVAIFLPLSAMLAFSFLTKPPIGSADWMPTLGNYADFFAHALYPYLLYRSLLLSAIVTGLCVLIGFPCAWVLAKGIEGHWRQALFLLIILPFWSNGLVRVFSWAIVLRSNGIIDYVLRHILPFDVPLDILYSFTAVVIGLVHSYLPYMILSTYLALQAIDDSLIEAARSLGAPARTIFWRLVLPLSAPGLAAGAVLTFVPVAGSFMEPRILGGRDGTFYGTVIEDQFTAVYNWPFGAALSFILLALILVLLALAAPALRRAQ